MTRSAYLGAAALAFFAANAEYAAAQAPVRLVVTPFVGGGLYLGDLPERMRVSDDVGVVHEIENATRDNGFAVGTHAGLRLGRSFGLEATFAYLPTTTYAASGIAGTRDADGWLYGMSGLYFLPAAGPIEPFITAGVGGRTYDVPDLATRTDFTGSFGGGLDLRLTPIVGLRLEARDYISWLDPDIAGMDGSLQHDLALTAGVSFRIPVRPHERRMRN